MAAESFWEDRIKAQKIVEESNSLKKRIEPLTKADAKIEDCEMMMELAAGEPDDVQQQILDDLNSDVPAFLESLEAMEIELMLTGPHDARNCILSINAGAGGTESCDWASMLHRMYMRWAELRGWKVEVTDMLEGETAGIKSVTMRIEGENAYGYCKAERGVHRLVRISPFDSNKRRHTSFSSVDAIAEIEEVPPDEDIPSDELRVDTFRSGGKGGQNVNKVETAVRITHLPTGLVAGCQTERSQHQNRANAMRMLLSKLIAMKEDQAKQEMERFYGEKGSVSWGNQIRSYVFQPYRMVKDLRTGAETSDVQGVMDGELDRFVNAWLRAGGPLKKMTGVADIED